MELDEQGVVKLQKGVVKNRRITIEDQEMRHGRKNRSKRFDGYKRHILKDLDNGMVRAVGVTMANLAEASVTEALSVDLEHQKVVRKNLFDLRRTAVVHNLHVLIRLFQDDPELLASKASIA